MPKDDAELLALIRAHEAAAADLATARDAFHAAAKTADAAKAALVAALDLDAPTSRAVAVRGEKG